MIHKATPGIIVAEIGKNFSGKRGIVTSSFWLHRQLWITVRWESGLVTDEAPGSLSVIKGADNAQVPSNTSIHYPRK